MTVIYPISGIVLTHDPTSLVLTSNPSSNPKAKAIFTLDINSIGLKGYIFSVDISLNMQTIKITSDTTYNITAIITSETGEPLANLNSKNFEVNGLPPTSVTPFYEDSTLVYKIVFSGTFPATVTVWDQRGICAESTVS